MLCGNNTRNGEVDNRFARKMAHNRLWVVEKSAENCAIANDSVTKSLLCM